MYQAIIKVHNQFNISLNLQALPDADELNELILKDDEKAVVSLNKNTGLLMSTWMGRPNILKACIQANPYLDKTDESGRLVHDIKTRHLLIPIQFV